MNLANINLLQDVGRQSFDANYERFTVIGSVARAAVLGYDLATLQAPHRFGDIDVIDHSGAIREKYVFENGGVLDGGLAKTLRPLSDRPSQWAIFDTLTGSSDEPVVTFSAKALGLGKITTGDTQPITFQTPDACGHLGLLALLTINAGPLGKHRAQFSELAKRREELCIGCNRDELNEAIGEYQSKVSERLRTHPLPAYVRLRRQLFAQAPWLAQHIVDGRLGETVRQVRHTQPHQITRTSLNDLLQSQHMQGAA